MSRSKPDRLLVWCSLLFVLLAVQSVSKPFRSNEHLGFVLLGERTDGLTEAVAAPVHAALMLALAYGIWRMKRYALWIIGPYALYVVLNISLYALRYGLNWDSIAPPPFSSSPALAFGFLGVFLLLALGVPFGTAHRLFERRDELS